MATTNLDEVISLLGKLKDRIPLSGSLRQYATKEDIITVSIRLKKVRRM
jgi:hypothetical protein